MSCDACRDAFRHEPHNERAAKVHAATNECCGCEKYTASDYSPGPVSDDEVLNLIIIDPTSLTNGALNPTLAMQIDRGGLSALRNAASNEEFALTIKELKARSAEKDRYFHGVLAFEAGKVRKVDGRRFLCVYDTGMEDKPHHADLMAPPCAAASNSAKKRAEMARWRQLVELIGESLVPAAQFRDGAFMEYART